jgi:hypothetical protein
MGDIRQNNNNNNNNNNTLGKSHCHDHEDDAVSNNISVELLAIRQASASSMYGA